MRLDVTPTGRMVIGRAVALIMVGWLIVELGRVAAAHVHVPGWRLAVVLIGGVAALGCWIGGIKRLYQVYSFMARVRLPHSFLPNAFASSFSRDTTGCQSISLSSASLSGWCRRTIFERFIRIRVGTTAMKSRIAPCQ